MRICLKRLGGEAGWERTSRRGTDRQLDTLGHYISECVECTVGDGKSIMRVRFEGTLINTGEGDARHGFKFFRLGREGWGRTERRQTDYILLVFTRKVIHSCHSFLAATPPSVHGD